MRTTRSIEVRNLPEACIRGTREGDATLLRTLFHPQAIVAGYLGTDLTVRNPDAFVERAATTPPSPGCHAAVTAVSVIGDTATGTVVEHGLWHALSFVNRCHLVRDADRAWRITAKQFHQDQPATAE